MKYGIELHESVFAPWRLSYVAYDVLKMELKTRQLDHEWNDDDEADFVQVSLLYSCVPVYEIFDRLNIEYLSQLNASYYTMN
jgi:SPX domain protein involved in polyphosphate accumulation